SRSEVTVMVTDPSFFRRVLAEGNLGLAESFMADGWRVTEGSLEEFLRILASNRIDEKVKLEPRVLARLAVLRAKQLIDGGRKNSQAHYDVGEDLYDTFLDSTRGYTCGYQRSESDTIEELQANKYERICRKLGLREGETLFDIGCGYGGLMIHAAKNYGVVARGITNSNAHGEFAMRRIRELGLEGRVTVEIGDYRTARGQYDKVCSVGVLEHLYPHEHRSFFGTFDSLLKKDGYGLLHTIGCVTATNDHDPFIQKYIFPGSTQNPISHIATWFERKKLAILDVENIARHYAPTSQQWLNRFREGRHTLDPKRYDASFLRMWEYYLALCVAGASATDGAVWQVLVTKEYRRPLRMIRV
ncbi:MAG TPA: class I SAM-dependent methyltransferase, partial [Labilithrix sp.]|nr:class I SAM-dependent methyltransferase [Labilithrix sp.]